MRFQITIELEATREGSVGALEDAIGYTISQSPNLTLLSMGVCETTPVTVREYLAEARAILARAAADMERS